LALLERNPGLDVLLIGRGSERFQGELVRSEPGVRERVRATGAAEPSAVTEHLRGATVALFPFVEGVSSRRTSLMSALQAGAAIVTTEGWCSESVWRASGAVELADPNEPLSAVTAVEHLLGDPARQTELRRRALALYDQRFHVDRVVARLHELASSRAPE
jgi:glycosyltransferase involved in cell wall biosynthesis